MNADNLSAEQARVLAQGPFPDYPFTPQAFVHANGLTQSYLDEGPRDGEVVVMLHGNPSWSFYWRKLVLGLRDRYRCIVPDHIGMGMSDRPGDDRYEYTLQSRIDDLDALLRHLGIDGPVTLAVHDWGGMIGFGWALKQSERVRRLVVLNTSAFPLPTAKRMPLRLRMGRDSRIGGFLIRRFNLFARGAAHFGTRRRLSPDVRRAYSGLYDGWDAAISTLRFMQDIPLAPGDRAWPLVEASAKKLPDYADRPVFLGWGLRDFVFDRHFLEGFRAALPKAEQLVYGDAGHYVLEDKADELVPAIRAFLDKHPL
ncbi:alpha/beta fold hydrolase [Arenimonas sp.]|uniref:alpha/beta fold hydrolase n=1 Tax=Arenimonas sp. TaxID=1872635 RepID=UPI0039E6E54A